MHNLSNETWRLMNQYVNQLSAMETLVTKNMNLLPSTCQGSELLYMQQHFQTMLGNIQNQKTWCKRICGQ